MLARIAFSARLTPRRFPPAVRLASNKIRIPPLGTTRGESQSTDYRLPSTAKKQPWQRPPSWKQSIPAQSTTAQQPLEESPPQDYHVAQGEEADRELDARSGLGRSVQPSPEDYHVAQGEEAVRELNSRASDPDRHETDQSAPSQPPQVEPESEITPEPTQRRPLPDLRYGIPSTLDAELDEAQSRRETPSGNLNITEDPTEPPLGSSSTSSGSGGDGLPRSSYISSSDRKKNTLFKAVYLAMALGSVGYVVYLGRNWTDEEEAKRYPDAPSGWGVGLFYNRVKARLGSNLDYYNDPVFTKLLPDEDKDPAKRFPFVLVLSLDDMLIHSEWTREKGWRLAKRPGLDYFLRYLCQYYEIVLFTSQPSAMASQVYQKLDPFRIIQWPLYREATLYKDRGYIKDLSYLNRPLNKVLMIDTDPHHAKNQPENAIILPKWTGDPNDQTLVQMIPFLEYLATMGFDDCRKVLQSFEGTYIPVEFARREKLLREKFEAQEAEKRGSRPGRRLGSLFGTKQDGNSGDESKMLWDRIREQGQKQFEALDKQIREEGDKWLAEEAAAMKKMEEEAMKEMKTKGLFGYFRGSSSDGTEK